VTTSRPTVKDLVSERLDIREPVRSQGILKSALCVDVRLPHASRRLGCSRFVAHGCRGAVDDLEAFERVGA